MFQVKGDQAQWRTLYDRLAGMHVDDLITYEELANLIPDAAEGSIRGALYRAVRQLEDDHSRTLDNVRGKGYRLVAAAEHERLARQQHRKARRRLKAATRKAHSADRTQLTREQRQRIDAIELHLSQQSDMIRRLDKGLKAETQQRKADTAELSERVDRLAALLERHGITASA